MILVSRDAVFKEKRKWERCKGNNEVAQSFVEFGNVSETVEPEKVVAPPESLTPQQLEKSGGSKSNDEKKRFHSLADIYEEAPLRDMDLDELLLLTTDEQQQKTKLQPRNCAKRLCTMSSSP